MEVRNAERAIRLMGASVLQLWSGMFVIFSESPTIYNLRGRKNEALVVFFLCLTYAVVYPSKRKNGDLR